MLRACNALLVTLKYLNHLEQVLIHAHLDEIVAAEALVLDSAGMLVKCCAANLLWRKVGAVFIPNLSNSSVASLMR